MFNLPIKILRTVQIEAETTSITIDNIDTLVAVWDALQGVTSRHLVLIINARSIDVSDAITNFLRFNGSAAMDYVYQRLSGVAAAVSAGRVDGANAINLPPICGANNADTWGGSQVVIPHAFNTTNHKVVQALGGAAEFSVEAVIGRWAQAAAITSVTIFEGVGDDFEVGSTVSIGVVDERYLVEEILLTGDGQPTFDNIPQGEGDLAVVVYARTDRAAVGDSFLHDINADVAANYQRQFFQGSGAATAAGSGASRQISTVTGNNATANAFGAAVIFYSQYTKGNQPHYLAMSGYHETSGPTAEARLMSGRRANTEPINKLHYEPNTGTDFKAGSLFSLYRVPKELIERVELTADQATITFADIPQNFEALALNVYAKSDRGASNDAVLIIINGDAVAANYNHQWVRGQAALVQAARAIGFTTILLSCPANFTTKDNAGGPIFIPSYTRTDRHKHLISLSGGNTAFPMVGGLTLRWLNTNAITQIVLDPSDGTVFRAESIFELWGILKKEGLPPSEGSMWGA